jgi:hypothetical protein
MGGASEVSGAASAALAGKLRAVLFPAAAKSNQG